MLRNPLTLPYMGPHIFFPADIKEANKDSFEQEVMAELMQQLPAAQVWNVALQPGMKQVGLLLNAGMEVGAKQTFLINLWPDEATLLGNMKENMRRNIKSAAQQLIVEEAPDALPQLYDFHKRTLTGKGRQAHYDIGVLSKLLVACVQHKAGTLLAAKKDGILQAIIWLVWDSECCYYFMGGQSPQAEGYKAMPLLLWQAMQNARAGGNNLFDLEGSVDAGVERFFRGFGGTRTLYLVARKNTSFLWRLKEFLQ